MDAKEIRKRKRKLKAVARKLKKKFIGIDDAIDKIIDNITVWYVTPDILTRPVIVNLWGLTGVGKTDLIRTLVKELKIVDSFVELQLTNKGSQWGSDNVESVLNCSSIQPSKPGVLLLDEIQRFRTIDDTGHEILDYKFSDVWMLLSDGKFAGSYRRRENLLDILFSDMYYSQQRKEMEEREKEEEVSDDVPIAEGGEVKPKKAKKVKRKYHQSYWDASRLKNILQLEEDLEAIMKWENSKKETMIYDALKSNDVNEGVMYSKLLIFISGNLDEAYRMASDAGNADIDADIFHEFSKKIDLIKIKEALKRRFKPEQISRMGNTHVIYPSLSKDSYVTIIRNKLEELSDTIFKQNGVRIEIDDTVVDFIYRNGVFPSQGVRPVLSTIVSSVENTLPFFILEALESNAKKVRVRYDEKNKAMMGRTSKKTMTHKLTGVIDNIKKKSNEEWQTIVSVHEAGHALTYALLFGLAPTQIKTKTTSDTGFVAMHEVVYTKERILDRATSCLAGQAAEEVVFGESMKTAGCVQDLHNATDMISMMVRDYGMDSFQSSIRNKHTYQGSTGNFNIESSNTSIEKILKSQKEIAIDMLKEHSTVLAEVARELSLKEEISPEDFKKLLAKHGIDIEVLPIKKIIVGGYIDKFDRFYDLEKMKLKTIKVKRHTKGVDKSKAKKKQV